MERQILYNNYQPEVALRNIKIDGKSIKSDKALQEDLRTEWKELVLRLFPESPSIMIEPMVSGYSGASVMAVRPCFEQGEGQKVVVKFGDVDKITLEHENCLRYAQPFIGGHHGTVSLRHCSMKRLGGIVYTFLGTNIDDMRDFGSFYSCADIVQIRQVLDHLFRQTCGLWYASTTPLRPLNLTELYRSQLVFNLRKIRSVVSGLRQKTLTFSALENVSVPNFTNPLYVLKNARPFVYSSYMTTTHGDLNQRNIFVDRNGYTYLIDFGRTGRGHILQDVAMLDCVIRFQLLSAEDATLYERLEMEEVLCHISRFSEVEQLRKGFSTRNQALMKAFDTVVHLRTLAHWMVERKPEDDIREYFVPLLYNTLDTLGFSSLDAKQYEHALLSASLLVDRLGLGKADRVVSEPSPHSY